MSAGKFIELPLDRIELDTDNPRIAHYLEHHEPPYTAEQIHFALETGGDDEERSGSSFNKLKQSILTSGRIVQPIIVQKVGKDRYRCIEGNTRLYLYREFRDNEVPGDWSKIPSLVHSEIPEDEVHAIRLQAHLVGPRQWDPYSKAKYLTHLRNQEHFTFAQLVDLCGGNKKSIVEILQAYEDMEAHYRPLVGDANFDPRRFSGFVELQKAGVKAALRDTGFSIRDFSEWIHDRRIDKLADVRRLQGVLRNERAREIFLDKGMEEASRVLDRPQLNRALEDAELTSLCQALRQAIDSMAFNEMRRLRTDPTAAETTLQYLEDARDSIRELISELDPERTQ